MSVIYLWIPFTSLLSTSFDFLLSLRRFISKKCQTTNKNLNCPIFEINGYNGVLTWEFDVDIWWTSGYDLCDFVRWYFVDEARFRRTRWSVDRLPFDRLGVFQQSTARCALLMEQLPPCSVAITVRSSGFSSVYQLVSVISQRMMLKFLWILS